jgi:hypothetical protein
MIYMEPGLSPGYRREEEEEDKEGLEKEEEEASPGFVDSWLRRCVHPIPIHSSIPASVRAGWPVARSVVVVVAQREDQQ